MSTSSRQDREAVRVELGEVEHVADEALEPLRLLGHDHPSDASIALRVGRRRPSRSAATWPRIAVSGVRSSCETDHQEVSLALLRLGEPRGHLAEAVGEVADLAAAADARDLDVVAAPRRPRRPRRESAEHRAR